MSKIKKSALIIPYFGKFPEWFQLYMYSCKKNETIDFIFFTDCPRPNYEYSNNVKFYNISFEDYCKMVSEKLGIKFCPKSSYKLCDLRPWYGIIHDNILKDYEYWGYGDIDLVYGNLNSFLNDFFRKKMDVFSTHSDRISGHFCLLRNNDYYIHLPFTIPNWEKLLTDDKHYGIDEGQFSLLLLKRQRYFRSILYRITKEYSTQQRILSTVNNYLFRNICAQELHTSPKPLNGENWIYNANTGEIIVEGSENRLPYLHFLFFKKTIWWKENTNYWKPGFYKVSEIHPDMILKINNREIMAASGNTL